MKKEKVMYIIIGKGRRTHACMNTNVYHISTGRYGNMGRIRKIWKDEVDTGEMVRKKYFHIQQNE